MYPLFIMLSTSKKRAAISALYCLKEEFLFQNWKMDKNEEFLILKPDPAL